MGLIGLLVGAFAAYLAFLMLAGLLRTFFGHEENEDLYDRFIAWAGIAFLPALFFLFVEGAEASGNAFIVCFVGVGTLAALRRTYHLTAISLRKHRRTPDGSKGSD